MVGGWGARSAPIVIDYLLQVFIISVVTDEMNTVPVVWGFLTRKNQHLYQFGVFAPLRKKLEALQGVYIVNPIRPEDSIDNSLDENTTDMVLAPVEEEKIIVCDFERGIFNAIKKEFPQFIVFGCKFHWKAVMREHLKEEGLIVFEAANEEFYEVVQWLLVLVYVRPVEVEEYFDTITDYIAVKLVEEQDAEWVPYGHSLQTFCQYVLDTWIGTESKPAMFDSDHWSANRSLVDPRIPTTSNGTEAYNQAFTKAVSNSANRFWRTVQAIQDEESYARYSTMYTYF